MHKIWIFESRKREMYLHLHIPCITYHHLKNSRVTFSFDPKVGHRPFLSILCHIIIIIIIIILLHRFLYSAISTCVIRALYNFGFGITLRVVTARVYCVLRGSPPHPYVNWEDGTNINLFCETRSVLHGRM